MTHKNLYRWCNRSRIISGNVHYLVERHDGVRFYLDDAFRFALEHFDRGEALKPELIKMGATPDEISELLKILQSAGLVETCSGNE
jgi:hypothetical protein